MAVISNSRGKNVLGFRLAIGVVSALGCSSPALAETKTLSCEGETGGMLHSGTRVGPTPWSGSIDIDYGASRISVPRLNITQAPAGITDREIEFKLLNNPPYTGIEKNGLYSSFGTIDRLSGALHMQLVTHGVGIEVIDARCRPATQKF